MLALMCSQLMCSQPHFESIATRPTDYTSETASNGFGQPERTIYDKP
jgi:hypothetical protein